MSKICEAPLLFRKRPYGVASYNQFGMSDKGNMIDESLCIMLNIPVKDLQYTRFTILPGMITRCTGRVKFSSQKIQKGKVCESIQFSGRVIRNLTELLGKDAVSGHSLSEKLSDLPFVKPTKPEKKVKLWIEKYHNVIVKTSSDASNLHNAYPTGTPSFHPCVCDWSHAATAAKSLQCCVHCGLCQECQGNLVDLQEDTEQLNEEDNSNDVVYEEADDGSIMEANHIATINPWVFKYGSVHAGPSQNYEEKACDKPPDIYLTSIEPTNEDLTNDDDEDTFLNDNEDYTKEEMRRITAEHGYDDYTSSIPCHNPNDDPEDDEITRLAAEYGYSATYVLQDGCEYDDEDYGPDHDDDDYDDEWHTEEYIATAERFGYILKNRQL